MDMEIWNRLILTNSPCQFHMAVAMFYSLPGVRAACPNTKKPHHENTPYSHLSQRKLTTKRTPNLAFVHAISRRFPSRSFEAIPLLGAPASASVAGPGSLPVKRGDCRVVNPRAKGGDPRPSTLVFIYGDDIIMTQIKSVGGNLERFLSRVKQVTNRRHLDSAKIGLIHPPGQQGRQGLRLEVLEVLETCPAKALCFEGHIPLIKMMDWDDEMMR